MQDLETHVAPLPPLSCSAADSLLRLQEQRIEIGQRRDEPVDRQRLQHRARSAAVVGVIVADHDRVQTRDAQRTKVGHDYAAAAVGLWSESWPRVIEKCV